MVKGLKGKKVVKVSAGEFHNAALTASGEVYTWGCGAMGQVGGIPPEPPQLTAIDILIPPFHCFISCSWATAIGQTWDSHALWRPSAIRKLWMSLLAALTPSSSQVGYCHLTNAAMQIASCSLLTSFTWPLAPLSYVNVLLVQIKAFCLLLGKAGMAR